MPTVTTPPSYTDQLSAEQGHLSTRLPSMLATLCSYESWLGPYHPQTLSLMTQIALAYWQAGEISHARPLLERAIRDLERCLGRDHDLRLQALAALRDLFLTQRNFHQAGMIQRELLEWHTQSRGNDHPETQAVRAYLAKILLAQLTCEPNRES